MKALALKKSLTAKVSVGTWGTTNYEVGDAVARPIALEFFSVCQRLGGSF